MAKYQKYAEYKDSGIDWMGEIPKSWSISRLKYIAEIFGRIGFRGYTVDDIVDEGEGALVLSPSNILGDQFSLDKKTYLSWKKYYESPEIMVGLNDILLVKTGSTYGKSTIILEKKEPMTINPQMALLKKIKLEPRFLYYLFQSTLYKAVIDISNTGSGMPTMTQENINSFPIPFSAFNETLNIANFLDHETAKIDTLIAKQEKLIELLKEKRQAVISHAVTKGLNPNVPMKDSGVEWLGEVPEHWAVTKVGFHTLKIGSGKTPKGGAEIYQDEGVLFIRSQNVYNEGLRIDSSESTYISEAIHDDMSTSKVYSGDILLNITGGSIGRSSIVPDEFPEANVNQHVCIIRVRKYLQKFLALVIQSDLIQAQIQSIQTGGNREGLNFEQISKFYFALPSTEEQKQLIKYIEDKVLEFSKLEVKASNAIQLMQERRTALISAAVTGKIDVRNWQHPNQKNEADVELSA